MLLGCPGNATLPFGFKSCPYVGAGGGGSLYHEIPSASLPVALLIFVRFW